MTQNILLTLCAALLIQGIPGNASQDRPAGGEVLNTRIPVTSQQIDLADDPENAYSGAPQFHWSFFGGQTRVITK